MKTLFIAKTNILIGQIMSKRLLIRGPQSEYNRDWGYKLLSLSLMTINFAYSMHQKTEEQMFQDNLTKLSEPIKAFVKDFQTWPKEEQNKIVLFSNSGGVSFLVKDKHASKNEKDIKTLLPCPLLPSETIPLFLVLQYIKEYN